MRLWVLHSLTNTLLPPFLLLLIDRYMLHRQLLTQSKLYCHCRCDKAQGHGQV